jgi:hypothetical protein
VQHWANVGILPGHTDSYPAGGNAVYIQNHGASRLQVLYIEQQNELTPEDAGWSVETEIPEV